MSQITEGPIGSGAKLAMCGRGTQPDTSHIFTEVMWQNGLRWFAKNL